MICSHLYLEFLGGKNDIVKQIVKAKIKGLI